MAQTAAERQKKYRAGRAAAGPKGHGDRRLNTWVSMRASLALRRLAKRHGITQREMLERLLESEQEKVLDTMDVYTPEYEEYFAL